MLSRCILTDIKVFFVTQSLILVPYFPRNIEEFLDDETTRILQGKKTREYIISDCKDRYLECERWLSFSVSG